MTDKELIQQAFNALDKLTDLFPDSRGGHGQEAEDARNAALVVMEDLAARLQQPATKKLGFDDALKIAYGCFDYMGGYRDDNLYIYHHGIQTVVNCLEAAKEKGLKDSQIRAVHIIGTEEIERQMKHEQKP